ncbi:hypothetical protein CLIB1423_18S01244 [[Candida] railenensis]|uniref:Uncharacterized protein n=1 Tax=[Candida] railenensis TaxID=45579 RepID=A0A9P0QUB9_9ASCO|nr:hypothetical protein CLIB1423_18S01244 [[Candida] railenensis]
MPHPNIREKHQGKAKREEPERTIGAVRVVEARTIPERASSAPVLTCSFIKILGPTFVPSSCSRTSFSVNCKHINNATIFFRAFLFSFFFIYFLVDYRKTVARLGQAHASVCWSAELGYGFPMR